MFAETLPAISCRQLSAINGAVESVLFVPIFVRSEVYEPVTDDLLRALGILPR